VHLREPPARLLLCGIAVDSAIGIRVLRGNRRAVQDEQATSEGVKLAGLLGQFGCLEEEFTPEAKPIKGWPPCLD
jgi:hypothetical protein